MDASLRDVTRILGEWLDAARPCVLATVVTSDGSAPRGLGARLAIAGAEEWVGALSGGCTEAAVIAEAERLLADGDPDHAVYVTYRKETLVDVGPVCGSVLGVVVEVVDDVLVGTLERLVDTIGSGSGAELGITWSWQGAAPEELGSAGLALGLVREAVTLEELEGVTEHGLALARDESGLVLREEVPAAPHLVLGGAGDIARELVLLADRLAWRTTVVDARTSVLDQLQRMCSPSRAVTGWAADRWDELGVDSRTACVALFHESRHDEPFLREALLSDATYVGAVGSRRVQAERRSALAAAGMEQTVLDRLRGPAGLDLGGSAAAEIAVSIAGEVIASLHGRGGGSLSASDGPIRAT